MKINIFPWQFRSLYGKVAAMIFVLVTLTSAAQLYVASEAVKQLGQEAEQQAYWPIATALAERLQAGASPKFDRDVTTKAMFEFRLFNPNLNIFLLDATGNILLHYPEVEVLRHTRVPVELLEDVLTINPPQLPVFGLNPIDFRKQKTLFSIARLEIAGKPGYVYATFTGLSSQLLIKNGQFVLTRVAVIAAAVIGLAAVVLGIAMFFLTTRRFRQFISILREFAAGNFLRRVSVEEQDEVAEIGIAINSLADSVVAAQAALEQRDQTRRDLVADVSHDLRSPVAAIQLRTDLLEEALDENNSSKAREQLPALQRSITALQRLVTDLFELTKLEMKQVLSLQPVEVVPLLQAAVEQVQPLAANCGIAVQLEQPSVITQASCTLDAAMIQRLLLNLLENAIRHSPESATVWLRARCDDALVVEVRDEGSGIAEQLNQSLFLRGERSAASSGAGLGLAICRTIAELHGGTVSYSAAPEGGSIFRISLPLAQGLS